ncbi:hypothetical protein ACWNYH_00215 [Candidatus Vidania fulgoroideorum]
MKFLKRFKINKSILKSSDFKKLFRYISTKKYFKDSREIIKGISERNKILKNSTRIHLFLNNLLKFNYILRNSISISGTGGDVKNTINLTTMACITLCVIGQKTIKNNGFSYNTNKGSYKFVSKLFGSNLLKNTLYSFNKYKKTNIFLYSTANIINRNIFGENFKKIRRSFKGPTFFNYSLSSFNPFKSKYFVLGVNKVNIAKICSNVLKTNGSKYSIVISNYKEIDEPTLFGKLNIIKRIKNKKLEVIIDVGKIGFKKINSIDYILAKNIKESIKIFKESISSKNSKIFENIILYMCLVLNVKYNKKISFPRLIIENIKNNGFVEKKFNGLLKYLNEKNNIKQA